MTEVDDSVMYHAESQIREKEPHPDDGFSDTDDDLLYHAVSQIEALSAPPTSPVNPQPDPPTSTLEARPEPPTSRQEVVQSDPPTTNVEALPEPPNFQGSDDTVILPHNDLLMTDSEYDTLFFGTIQNSGVDETRILDEFTESNNPPVVSRQEDAPGGPQPDILRDAAAAAGLSPNFAVHWDDSIPEHQLAQALTHSPPSFESSRFDLIESPQQTPKTQTFSDGNMDSALRHLRSVVELRQWAEEYQVAEHPRVLRALINLGDSDALVRLQLQGMSDFKAITEWASLNRVSDNVHVREKLLRIAEDYGIAYPDVAGDCTLAELAVHIQNGMLPALRFRARPIESLTEVSVDSAVQQTTANNWSRTNADEGVSVRSDMVGRGDNTDPNGGQQSSSENRSNEDPVGLSRQSVRDHVGDNSMHETMGENPVGFSQPTITQRVGNNYDQVTEGLDQIDGRSDMDGGEVVVETFQALTESRSEIERGSQRPDMIGRGDDSSDEETARFPCEFCGSSFAYRQDLTRHINHKHRNVIHPCPKCLKSFSTGSNLNRHKLNCTGKSRINGYQCLQCKKVFSSTTGLRKHCSTHHNTAPKSVTCRTCNTKFSGRSELSRHKKNDRCGQ